jgi:hypothetical protein
LRARGGGDREGEKLEDAGFIVMQCEMLDRAGWKGNGRNAFSEYRECRNGGRERCVGKRGKEGVG